MLMENVKSGLGWARIITVSLFCLLAFELMTLFSSGKDRQDKYLRLMRVWGRLFLMGADISLSGEANIPSGEAVIFASNHQSYFDIPLFHALSPVPFRWMSRHDLFSTPFIGRTLKRIGAVEVARHDRKKAARSAIRVVDMLSSGSSVVIFPEGTWGDEEGRMREFKRGVIRIARKTGAKVVPVTIIGANRVNPPHTKLIRYGNIKMIIHPPMGPETWHDKPDDVWLLELRETIASALDGQPPRGL